MPCSVMGQLKSQDKPVEISEEIIRPSQNSFMGLSIFDPSKFNMTHSLSMSFFSVGGKGVSQQLYLNTMTYQIANPLFQNGFFLSGAELQYKPSDKLEMRVQFSSMPNYMYNNYWYNNSYRPYQNWFWDQDEKK